MKITLSELQKLSNRALAKYGYSEAESKSILDLLLYAQLRGNNQGIVKLIGRGIPKHKLTKSPAIEKESPTTAIINANLTTEAIAMEQAVAIVIKKQKAWELRSLVHTVGLVHLGPLDSGPGK